MKYIKLFDSFNISDTFSDIYPSDLTYMTREQIVELISNTFESEIVSNDPEWTIVKSKWEVIHKDDDITKSTMEEILDIKKDVFFHISKNSYKIIRGDSEDISNFIRKNSLNIPNLDTESGSLILSDGTFYEIFFALKPIPKGEGDMQDENGDYYHLHSMSCGSDIRLQNEENISYFSDLLIGSDVIMVVSLENKYPGLTKMQALQKETEERTKPTLTKKIIKGSKEDGIYKKTPNYEDYKDNLVKFSYENMLFDICDDIITIKNVSGQNNDDIIYFYATPKKFEKMKFNMHEYEPAEVYYANRIYQIQDEESGAESFIFQWFGKLFASKEHLQNYYKKYPKFGPGGDMHTFKSNDGTEQLSYQPPMFKDSSDFFKSNGDTIGSLYYCEDRSALFTLLEVFNDFVKDSTQSHFETDYPIYKKKLNR